MRLAIGGMLKVIAEMKSAKGEMGKRFAERKTLNFFKKVGLKK